VKTLIILTIGLIIGYNITPESTYIDTSGFKAKTMQYREELKHDCFTYRNYFSKEEMTLMCDGYQILDVLIHTLEADYVQN